MDGHSLNGQSAVVSKSVATAMCVPLPPGLERVLNQQSGHSFYEIIKKTYVKGDSCAFIIVRRSEFSSSNWNYYGCLDLLLHTAARLLAVIMLLPLMLTKASRQNTHQELQGS